MLRNLETGLKWKSYVMSKEKPNCRSALKIKIKQIHLWEPELRRLQHAKARSRTHRGVQNIKYRNNCTTWCSNNEFVKCFSECIKSQILPEKRFLDILWLAFYNNPSNAPWWRLKKLLILGWYTFFRCLKELTCWANFLFVVCFWPTHCIRKEICPHVKV